MIAVTFTSSPPTALTTLPHTSVEATTLILPSAGAAAPLPHAAAVTAAMASAATPAHRKRTVISTPLDRVKDRVMETVVVCSLSEKSDQLPRWSENRYHLDGWFGARGPQNRQVGDLRVRGGVFFAAVGRLRPAPGPHGHGVLVPTPQPNGLAVGLHRHGRPDQPA